MGLGNWIKAGLGLGLAPLTGGASLGILGTIGQSAGNASAARGQGRLDEAKLDIERNRAMLEGLNTDLAQRRFNQSDYQTSANNAIRGGLLQGTNDVNITGLPQGITMGNVTGGLRPSAITNKGQIGETLQRDAIARMLNPQTLPGVPQLPAVPQAGKLDKFLNIFGSLAPIFDQFLGNASRGRRPGIDQTDVTN